MRHLKMLGVAAVAVFALVAFAGATTASATVLCSTNSDPCPAGNVYPSGTSISGTSSSAVLTTSGGVINPRITCTNSTNTLTTSSAGGAGVAISGNITALTFSSCTSTGPTGCSTSGTVSGLPGAGTASWTSGFNGSLSITTVPSVSFTCPVGSTNVTCVFGGSGTVNGSITGGRPASVAFVGAAIPSAGNPACPTTARWTATYVSSGTNAYYLTNS